MNKTRAKDMLIGGLLTGLLTGLCWSFVIELFSTDQVFDGVEMLCSLSVPALVRVAPTLVNDESIRRQENPWR